MKKYLSLVMIGLSLMLSGCNKDDNNDPNTPPTGNMRNRYLFRPSNGSILPDSSRKRLQ